MELDTLKNLSFERQEGIKNHVFILKVGKKSLLIELLDMILYSFMGVVQSKGSKY